MTPGFSTTCCWLARGGGKAVRKPPKKRVGWTRWGGRGEDLEREGNRNSQFCAEWGGSTLSFPTKRAR